jgi:hypothetical protein
LERGIGEEIKTGKVKERFGKVLRRFDIGTTPMDFICSRMRIVMLSFAVAIVFFLLIVLPVGLMAPLMMLAVLVITSIAIVITFIIVIGLMFAMMYPLADKVLQENWTKVTREGILVQHKLWITTGTMRNFVPFRNISRVDPIDDNYMEDRRRRTKLWYRIMVLYPEPPPGGLYHYYSDPKGLLVIYLKEPMKIHNLGYFGQFSLWPMPVDKVVTEVILDIDPKHHKKFIATVGHGIWECQGEEIDQ